MARKQRKELRTGKKQDSEKDARANVRRVVVCKDAVCKQDKHTKHSPYHLPSAWH